MITLLTRDGSRVGNAIIYGGETRDYPAADGRFEVNVFFVETDFGNHMVLTWKEIEELFTVGHCCDYQEWRKGRAHLIAEDRTLVMPNTGWSIPRFAGEFDDGPTAAN